VLPRLLLTGFLLAHALIHLGFISPAPRATAGGPAWPFVMDRSWVLAPLGLGPDTARVLGTALVALTIAGFAVAALVALGILPGALWAPSVAVGAGASMAVLVLFFHPWLILGVGIDLGLLWVVLVANWEPSSSQLG
jgi:hypothetical protein